MEVIEDTHLAIRVKGDLGFVFTEPIPEEYNPETIWNYRSLVASNGIAKSIFSANGWLMLRQLLALHRAVCLTASRDEIVITFAIGERNVNKAGLKHDVLTNIKYFESQAAISTTESER